MKQFRLMPGMKSPSKIPKSVHHSVYILVEIVFLSFQTHHIKPHSCLTLLQRYPYAQLSYNAITRANIAHLTRKTQITCSKTIEWHHDLLKHDSPGAGDVSSRHSLLKMLKQSNLTVVTVYGRIQGKVPYGKWADNPPSNPNTLKFQEKKHLLCI